MPASLLKKHEAVEHDTVIHPRPMEQIRTHSSAIVRVLRALVTPKQAKAASQAVGGPVAIMISYWAIVKTSIMLAVWFTGFRIYRITSLRKAFE